MKSIVLISAAALTLTSCNQNHPTAESTTEKNQMAEQPAQFSPAETDSLVNLIDNLRSSAESVTEKPVEVKTENMREKIKQKWSVIHFYSNNGSLIKIKTYPHPGISKRTEEFYFLNGKLALAVVEDDGSGGRGKPKSQLDKMYYFHNDVLIKEMKSNSENEFSVRSSDAEELLSEANEYVSFYKNLPQ